MIENKINLFIYPCAHPILHDDEQNHLYNGISQYLNTVPFSKFAIDKYFNITGPDNAEIFYMGQYDESHELFSIENFEFFEGREEQHIIDIEGDWRDKNIPKFLERCVMTINGAKKEYSGSRMFIRPTFSYLLIDLSKNRSKFERNKEINKKFGFRGQFDPHGVRHKLSIAFGIANLSGEFIFNGYWGCQNSLDSESTLSYSRMLSEYTFSLCPRGSGVDSVRFFESCYFGSIPIVVSNNFIAFEYEYKKDFYFRIDPDLSPEEMAIELKRIENTPDDVLRVMSENAQEYFENHVKSYFDDPTLKFLKWYGKN